MENSVDIRDQPIEKRQCRFADEKLTNSLRPYSFASCLSEELIKLELEYCNCTGFTSPPECNLKSIYFYNIGISIMKHYMVDQQFYCSYAGAFCLAKASLAEKVRSMHSRHEIMCMTSCIEMEINVIMYVHLK